MPVKIKKDKKNKEPCNGTEKKTLRNLWDYSKMCYIRILKDPEEKLECGNEKVFEEIMPKNFTNMAKDINLHIQEAR